MVPFSITLSDPKPQFQGRAGFSALAELLVATVHARYRRTHASTGDGIGLTILYLFADDAKIYCHVKDSNDKDSLQTGIENFVKWTDTWQVKLNIPKCKIISCNHRRYSANDISINYVMNHMSLGNVQEIKDLGVSYDSLLLFDKHVSEKVKKAYMMLGLIKRNFIHVSQDCFVILYKALVRSHLEYANSVWNPRRKIDIDKLERVQRRATKLIPELAKRPYSVRLKHLNLPTLKYRRYRGDMIEVFKIIKGIYDSSCAPTFSFVSLSDELNCEN